MEEIRLLLWFYVISAAYLAAVVSRRGGTDRWYAIAVAGVGLASGAGLLWPRCAGPAFVVGTAGTVVLLFAPGILVRLGRRAAARGRFGAARRWLALGAALLPAEGLRRERDVYRRLHESGTGPEADTVAGRVRAGLADRGTGGRPVRAANALLVALLLLHAFASVYGDTRSHLTLLELGANFGPLVRHGETFRLVTAMFLHIGHLHLAVNAFAIWILGRWVEPPLGPARLLVVFLVSGIVGNVASLLLYADTGVAMISAGASGGAMGLVGAATAPLLFRDRSPEEARRLSSLVLVIGATAFLGLVEPMIDNGAHLGGLGAGLLLGFWFARRGRRRPLVARGAAVALLAATVLCFGWMFSELPRWREMREVRAPGLLFLVPAFYTQRVTAGRELAFAARYAEHQLGGFAVRIRTEGELEAAPAPGERRVRDPGTGRVADFLFDLPEGDEVLEERVADRVVESVRFR